MVISFIRNKYEDMRRSIPEFIKKFKDGEELKKIEHVVKEANNKGIYSAAKITYKYTSAPKLISYEDHFDLEEKNKKKNEDAKEILQVYYKEENIEKILISAVCKENFFYFFIIIIY